MAAESETVDELCSKFSDISMNSPKFEPPVYLQRYFFAHEFLSRNGVKSAVDFGCAECKFIRRMAKGSNLEYIAGVDIDKDLVKQNCSNLKPQLGDYVIKRENSLTIECFVGNVIEVDDRLRNCEAATLIELIEHLSSDTLAELPDAIFGRYNFTYVLISTPNSDFNVLFPDLKGFRHWDHKFEWTQSEFQLWCCQVAQKYNYSVEFNGVGEFPASQERGLGYCSQIALFIRTCEKFEASSPELNHPYELIKSIEYPFLSLENKIKSQIQFEIYRLQQKKKEEIEEMGIYNPKEIAIVLQELLDCYTCRQYKIGLVQLRAIILSLSELQYELLEDTLIIVEEIQTSDSEEPLDVADFEEPMETSLIYESWD